MEEYKLFTFFAYFMFIRTILSKMGCMLMSRRMIHSVRGKNKGDGYVVDVVAYKGIISSRLQVLISCYTLIVLTAWINGFEF